ncbi:peptidyl-prolyl cis-trans isomerase [Spiroplasma helicoides]|uniref:Peptidyl-prolyl cis-trans isomerase n=1 Tax=Spiroplasma helicoides TaxID=216938 RepID=A0A1B3SJ83_9MOLU|nr:peptidylprolyl isomerase [Spiroplasma helicoides]AOG59991.1 peptidyl-prolyl cis-trans isomerase [Spiroplasma helicoides]
MKSIKIKINLKDGRSMKAEIYPEIAPITTGNFLRLINENYFNDLIFHRVIKGFMIQGGGLFESLEEKGGLEPIRGEFQDNGWDKNMNLKHEPGILSMARTNVMNSATSQFFIVTGDATFLDGKYASFGKLSDEDSLKIALDIQNVKTKTEGYYDDVPEEPIIIKNIEKME